MYNLGHVLTALGRYAEAEPLVRASVELRRESLGPEHPGTLYLISGLANLLRLQGRLDEAERLLRPCLETQRRVLGPNHPETTTSIQRMKDLQQDRERARLGTPPPQDPSGVARR